MYLSEQPGNVNPAVDGVTEPTPDPTIQRSATGWQGARGSGEGPIYAGWGGAQPDRAPYGESTLPDKARSCGGPIATGHSAGAAAVNSAIYTETLSR